MTDAIQNYRQRISAERHRIDTIEKLGQHAQPELESKVISEGWTPQQFELELLRSSRPPPPMSSGHSHSMPPEVLELVALSAAGVPISRLEKKYDERLLDLSDKYRGIGFQVFCELACHEPLPRFRRDAAAGYRRLFPAFRYLGFSRTSRIKCY